MTTETKTIIICAFPTALILGDIGAAIVYACYKDWRMFVYWVAAATLTASVTYK